MEPTSRPNGGEVPADVPELFRALVAEADEGVVVLGPDGGLRYANPAANFLLGRGRTEIASELADLTRTVEDDRLQVNLVARDGSVRVAELRLEPLPPETSGNQVLRLKDITAYQEDAANAREQVRRRDEFLAMLSHEIRNPLAAIRSAAQLLTQDTLDTETRRFAGQILDRQFKHLGRILDDLLDVTRISRGKLEIVRERVELTQIVRDAVAEVAPLADKRGQRLRVDLPPGPVWVEGDATRLQQVVTNLLNNAAKFTPPQGNISLVLTVGKDVGIHVRDDGPGIPEELRSHIFEPFVQGKQTIARSEGGLGIGLNLAQTLARLHGGCVEAESNQDGPGTTFTFWLPAALGPAPAANGRAARATAPTPAPPLRILLVEDSADARQLFKILLQFDGHEVLEAADGPNGLTALLKHRPDVALVDIGLPGMDGYELARRARQLERGRPVRLVALTGYGTPQDVQAARRAGFDGHLTKPIAYAELCRVLRESAPRPNDAHCPGPDGR